MAVLLVTVLPCIAFLACMSIDLAGVSAEHKAFQDAADATALQAAQQLSVSTPAALSSRDDEFARAQIGNQAENTTYAVTTTVSSDGTNVTVQIAGTRASFFANMMPPGGWQIGASATAEALGQTPLCVLSSGATGQDDLTVQNSAQLTANGCLVQANQNISVVGSGLLQAAMVQASGTSAGTTNPAAHTGAPTITDPFTGLNLNLPSSCSSSAGQSYNGSTVATLPAGVHCGPYQVTGSAQLTLGTGEHYFSGTHGGLTITGSGSVTGTDVVLVFDTGSTFTATGSGTMSIYGRQSGPLAGFALATTRAYTGTFTLPSDAITNVTGAIYIPNALLVVNGTKPAAQNSDWTVIDALGLELTGSPTLVINKAYAGSMVPVPNGVGSNSATAGVRLTQ